MFFRRHKPHVPDFDERLQALDRLGIKSARKNATQAVVMRGVCSAVIRRSEDGRYHIDPVGIVTGNEIGELVDGGNQKYWLTPSGNKAPALAEHLKDLHAFGEDLREGLGMTSFYNEGLGTVNSLHLYDRVVDRDRGVPKRAWDKTSA